MPEARHLYSVISALLGTRDKKTDASWAMRISRVSLEERKHELLAEIRERMPEQAEELGHILSLIEIDLAREPRAVKDESNSANHTQSSHETELAGESEAADSISAGHKWSNRQEYRFARHVIYAILKEHGGSAKRTDIATEAVNGGWRLGGKGPYYDVLAGIDYLVGKGKLRKLDDETVGLTEAGWEAADRADNRTRALQEDKNAPTAGHDCGVDSF